MLTRALNKITENNNLSREEAAGLIDIIGTGDANPAQIAALLAALRTKGETVPEITGFALRMREKALKINTCGIDTIADSCGTGGDGANTFNISTASAIVAAACGANIAKHSNFGITGKCGSSNVLEALNIPLQKKPAMVEKNLEQHSIAFIHAPFFHKSTFHLNAVRKEIGIRTIFNFLGPLTNPAKPTGQVIGVSNPKMLPKITETLRNLGCKKAMVACGTDPVMDEISICGKTAIYKLENGKIENFEITPGDFGMEKAALKEIAGGTPDVNAGIIKGIFSGQIKGAKLNILLLNASAVLWAANMAESLEQGVNIAAGAIEEGMAMDKLLSLSETPV